MARRRALPRNLPWWSLGGLRLSKNSVPVECGGELFGGFVILALEVIDAAGRNGEVGGAGSPGRGKLSGGIIDIRQCPAGDGQGSRNERGDQPGFDGRQGCFRTVSTGCAVQRKQPARLTLAAALTGHCLAHQLSPPPRAQSFFSSASLRILLPSIASAYIRFNSAFSFSSALSRFASATSI